MNRVICLQDNKFYDIDTFSALADEIRSLLRKYLACCECRGKAYYRKQTKDGKHACFGAYHKDRCPLKIRDSSSRHSESAEAASQIAVNRQTIDVAFAAYTPSEIAPRENARRPTGKEPSSSTPGDHAGQPGQSRNVPKRLRTLLGMLLRSDDFAMSDIEINTGAPHPFKARDLFVRFDDISEAHIGEWKGFWGLIDNSDENMTWLNTANRQNVSIPVEQMKDYLTGVLGITSSADLAGASALVFGILRVSGSGKGKWYVKAPGRGHIFIRPAS